MIVIILVIALFLMIGIFFLNGKGAFLIAGYNAMSEEEKDTYDEVALTKFMGKMMFSLAFNMVFWLLSDYYDLAWLFYLGLVIFLSITIFMLIYVNTGNRFKK